MAYSLDPRRGRIEPLCGFCTKKYTYEERLPKILNCGDTICLECVLYVLEQTRKCPLCYVRIKENNASKMPTDFSLLLKIPNTPENVNPSKMRLKTLQCLVEIWQKRMKKNTEIINILNDKFVSCVETLNNYKVVNKGTELGNVLYVVEQQLRHLDFVSYSYYKPQLQPDINRRSYSTKDEFFFQIIFHLKERKKIYAFKSEWYSKRISFGELSYNEEKAILFIHSFTMEYPTFDSLFVSLNDLKESTNIHEFRTFLVIEDEFLICEMITSSVMALNFIRLCSGEDGFSFKGSSTRTINLPGLEDMIEIGVEMPKPVISEDYKFLRNLPNLTTVDLEDKLRIRMHDNKCELVKLQSPPSCDSYSHSSSSYGDNFDDVVASANESGSIFVYSYIDSTSFIQNCGICFEIPII